MLAMHYNFDQIKLASVPSFGLLAIYARNLYLHSIMFSYSIYRSLSDLLIDALCVPEAVINTW